VLDTNGQQIVTNGKKQFSALLAWRTRELSDAFSTKLVSLVRERYPGALG
jgi:hypothetical protein